MIVGIDGLFFRGRRFLRISRLKMDGLMFGVISVAPAHPAEGVLIVVDVVLPKAVSLVRYIPIPRIEYQDADIDLVIENLVFESDNFLPSKVRIDTNSHAEFTSAYTFESEYSNSTTVRINEFRVRARDISFAFRKKTGFFQFEDKGLLDVYVSPSPDDEI